MVECHLAKVNVAGSNPVSRSNIAAQPSEHQQQTKSTVAISISNEKGRQDAARQPTSR